MVDTNIVSTKVRSLDYPAQFFNVIKYSRPANLGEAIKWAKILYDTVGIIKQAVRKLAIYPITDVVITKDDDGFYETLLTDTLKIKSFNQKVGMDYFTYGMAYVSPVLPFDRYLVCSKCKKEVQYDKVKKLTYTQNYFTGTCPKCKHSGKMKIKDVDSKDPSRMKLKRWYPGNIEVIENEVTGDYRLIYSITKVTASKIRKGDIWFLKNMPIEFMNAVYKKSLKVELNNKMVYIMSIPEPSSPDTTLVGQPFISGSWTDAFILKVLKKAQETMAADRFVSYRVLFPETRDQSPLKMMNLRSFRSNVNKMLKRFYSDPNEMGISPIPIGQLHIGGDGKTFNNTPELDAQKRDLLADIGVPYEFIYGGLSYSGSSVSLRMLENIMLNYRESLEHMMKFICNVGRTAFKKAPVGSVKLSDFKMADDIQKKNLLGNLNMQQKISDKTLLGEYGLDPNTERSEILKEVKGNSQLFEAKAVVNAAAQAKAQSIARSANVHDSIVGSELSGGDSLNLLRSGHIGLSSDAVANAIQQMSSVERSSTLDKLNQTDPARYQQVMAKLSTPVDMKPLPEQSPPTRGPDKGVI